MSTVKETANTVKLARLIWMFLFVVLLTAPLFPGSGQYGFYSVEWSFFFCAFFLLFFTIITWWMGEFTPRWDKAFNLLLLYWIMGFISLVDADDRIRGLLFWGQYIPYFLMIVLTVSLIRSENSLNNLLNKLNYLSLFFCLIVIVAFVIIGERRALSDFLLNNTNIDSNRILSYIELPFCVAVYRMFTGQRSKINILMFIITIILTIISGSRGSILILIGILGLVILKSKSYGKGILLGALAALLITAALFLSPYTADRFDQLFSASESIDQQNAESVSRLYTGMIAFQTLVDHPFNGVGMGNLSKYSQTALNQIYVPPAVRQFWHSRKLFETTCTPLKMGGEIGVFGFFFFFVWYFYIWRRIKLVQRHQRRKAALQILAGLEIYVIASFVHNFLDCGFWNYYSWVFYGIILAATDIYNNNPRIIRG